MARTPDLMQRAYLGTEIREEVLHFEPRLPGPIQELSFTVRFRRTPLLVTLNKNGLTLALHPEGEIARANDAGLLTAAHADIVVTTLDDIDLSALANGRLATKKA
jgi:trehalose/maltose hydrolase-like predicted phosphorylase